MFNLPERTLYNRRIPKTKFYEKLQANTRLKEMFVDEVENIIWKYKLSRETINIEPTEDVQEIQVFEIQLKKRELSRDVLESIDKAIPYPILFVLRFEEEGKLTIAFKQRNQNVESRYVIKAYYESSWMAVENLEVNLTSGMNLRDMYENLIRSLMGEVRAEEDLEEVIEKQKQIEKLTRECDRLMSKIKAEKQYHKQVEYNLELQKKKKELEMLRGEK